MSKTNRRDFLKTTSTIGVGYWVAAAPTFTFAQSANEKLNMASIGCGGMGGGDLSSLAGKGCNVVALCDVDERNAAGAFNGHPNAKKFSDWRVMLDKMGKEIDLVNVSTPDHTHAVATMAAMKRGIHVYTQKPLTHDVYEARVLTEAAKEYKVVTQMGNQGTSHDGLRQAVEVIRSGAVGKPLEVHVWTNRPVWPQGIDRPKEKMDVPGSLKWDLWLGTAPERPYHEAYMPFKWRGWVDYGTGALGDMACHTANMAFMACDLKYPTSVECRAMSNFNGETFPTWSVIEYEFPARGELPPLRWTWYDGGNDKPKWVVERLKKLAYGKDIPGSGSLIICEKGTVFSPDDYGSQYFLLPEKDFEGYEPPAPSLPRAGGDHYGEFVNAIRAGDPSKTMSNFGYAGPFTETVVLGCVALQAGKRIDWDGPKMKITNDSKANDLLRREYRKGWSL